MLYPGDVKQLIDGSVGQLRAKLCVSLNGIQDLVLILGSSHLKGRQHRLTLTFSNSHFKFELTVAVIGRLG